MPLGAYWKLPIADLGHYEFADACVSNVTNGESLPVNNEDFIRAFSDVAYFMKELIQKTRSARATPEWELFKYIEGSI